jgi:hypothetical protein
MYVEANATSAITTMQEEKKEDEKSWRGI